MRNQAWMMTLALWSAALCAHASAQMTPQAVRALQARITVERETPLTSVPLKDHMTKLAIEATLNGVRRDFIFDTGSPTMISTALAQELDLKVIGSNTGRDANGTAFTTQIAIVDRLQIGGVTLRKVPVLIADFSVSDPKGCFIKDGLIGSEVLPSSVWRIDPDRGQLHIAANDEDLSALGAAEPTLTAPLISGGYPHAPIVPYSIGDFKDNALFDTGHSASVVLFNRVLENRAVDRAIVKESVREGRGSLGVSAAGVGEETDLLRFDIQGMRLGNDTLDRPSATIRTALPSLIGLGMLRTHAVTLDYVSGRFQLHPRDEPEPARPLVGFGLMPGTDGVRVRQLYEGSTAKRAGLKLGDQVVAIDERALPTRDIGCEVTRWLVEDRPAASARQLTVLREGARVVIDLAKTRVGARVGARAGAQSK